MGMRVHGHPRVEGIEGKMDWGLGMKLWGSPRGQRIWYRMN